MEGLIAPSHPCDREIPYILYICRGGMDAQERLTSIDALERLFNLPLLRSADIVKLNPITTIQAVYDCQT